MCVCVCVCVCVCYFTLCEFSRSALAKSLSLESERQELSSGPQDFSQYSGRFKQFCSLNGLDSSSNLKLFQGLFRALGDSSKCANYNWYCRHLHILQLSLFSGKVSFFVIFTQWIPGTAKSTVQKVIFYFLFFLWSACISKSQRILCLSFYKTDSDLCMYHLAILTNFNYLPNSQGITLPHPRRSCLV